MPDTLSAFQLVRALPWWVLLPWGLGVLTAAGVAFTLFSSVGRRPRKVSATECPPVGSEDFVRAIGNTVNGLFVTGGTAELLDNGVRFFPAMFEAIRGAKQSVNFLAYIWKPGKVSDEMFAVLTERARAGVEVRVLLDGMGGIRAPEEGIAALRAAGGKVERFRPLRFGKITPVLQAHAPARHRHRRRGGIHRRRGRRGQLAGRRGGTRALAGQHGQGDGPLATSLQSAFAAPWANSCGEILVGPRFLSRPRGRGAGRRARDAPRLPRELPFGRRAPAAPLLPVLLPGRARAALRRELLFRPRPAAARGRHGAGPGGRGRADPHTGQAYRRQADP
jgi:hypothetical protein